MCGFLCILLVWSDESLSHLHLLRELRKWIRNQWLKKAPQGGAFSSQLHFWVVENKIKGLKTTWRPLFFCFPTFSVPGGPQPSCTPPLVGPNQHNFIVNYGFTTGIFLYCLIFWWPVLTQIPNLNQITNLVPVLPQPKYSIALGTRVQLLWRDCAWLSHPLIVPTLIMSEIFEKTSVLELCWFVSPQLWSRSVCVGQSDESPPYTPPFGRRQ
jgi:hypothetical protein